MFDYTTAFARNIGLLSENEQGRLCNTCVAIAGMGAVGRAHALALALAHMGVGRFHIAGISILSNWSI